MTYNPVIWGDACQDCGLPSYDHDPLKGLRCPGASAPTWPPPAPALTLDRAQARPIDLSPEKCPKCRNASLRMILHPDTLDWIRFCRLCGQ